MRELAQRSANAAKEIKALITTSSDQVNTGVSLVGETGKALQLIVSEVQEINTAVNNMDQGTQKNAAMVEEQTAASHALAREAAALNELLQQFRLGNSIQAAPAQPTLARPVAATARSKPAVSPARALGRTVAKAFAGKATAAAAAPQDDWEEF